jgi:hypothetical protein
LSRLEQRCVLRCKLFTRNFRWLQSTRSAAILTQSRVHLIRPSVRTDPHLRELEQRRAADIRVLSHLLCPTKRSCLPLTKKMYYKRNLCCIRRIKRFKTKWQLLKLSWKKPSRN